jgi:hypothetical protein
MTASDIDASRVRARGSALDDPEAATAPPAAPRLPVTQRARQAAQVMAMTATFLGTMLNKPGTLVHSQPGTFSQTWDRHMTCARHYNAAVLRWPRIGWGVVHTGVIKPVLNLVEVITSTPPGAAVCAAIGVVWWAYWGRH